MRNFGHQGRVDANQVEIVAALRAAGCTIQSLARIGAGCPDLLACRAGHLYLLEVKSDGGQRTTEQRQWLENWNGPVHLVRSIDEALAAVGLAKRPVLLAKQAQSA